MVECQFSKLMVAGSSPVSRLKKSCIGGPKHGTIYPSNNEAPHPYCTSLV